MKNLIANIKSFLREEAGLTIVEYAVAGGLISAGAVAAFQTLGVTVAGLINGVNTLLGG